MNDQDENLQAPLNPSMENNKSGEHIRVRRRIRVKKKKNPKKKIRKFFERIVWTIIILAFVVTIFYLLSELDLSDRRYKKKKTYHENKKNHELLVKHVNNHLLT